jgi:hypothetical protein
VGRGRKKREENLWDVPVSISVLGEGLIKEAYDILDLWNETHDWSQREKIFGGQTGYKKD